MKPAPGGPYAPAAAAHDAGASRQPAAPPPRVPANRPAPPVTGRPRGDPSCPTPRWCRGRGRWRSRPWSAASPASPGSCCWPPSSAPRWPAHSRWPISCRTSIAALVLEATFTAIFVPVLARAEQGDPDGGAAFVRRLVTLTTTLLLFATALSVLAAPAAGAVDARPQPTGQRAADHRLRLPAAAAGALLRPDVGVHGDPEHPQRIRADRPGRPSSTTSSRSRPWGCTWRFPASFRSIPSRWATPSCWCSASAPPWAFSRRPRCCWSRCAANGSACARCGASTSGSSASATMAAAMVLYVADQPARPGRRQPNRQHGSGFRARRSTTTPGWC